LTDRRHRRDRRQVISITVNIERRKAGRPRRFDAPLSEKLWFRLTSDEAVRVRAVARLNRQSLTDFIRDAVVEAAADCTDEPVLRIAS
jgi:hypothetical protein